jgi:UMF1 family MFS transporter
LPTALLFLVFALPCFFFVRERPNARIDDANSPRPTIQGSLTQTARTLREARKVPGLFTFLLANFFYSDALNTVIIAMGVYAVQVIGFSSAFSVLAPAILTAVIGSLLFGLVTDWLTAKQALVIALLMWVGVFLAAMFTVDKIIFQWVIAPVAGIALGSTWTAARTMMIELSPPERLGEFLGLYNLTGKFAAVLGPLLWGTTLLILDPRQYGQFAYQVAIATLLVMVVIGLALHLRTPKIRRQRSPK